MIGVRVPAHSLVRATGSTKLDHYLQNGPMLLQPNFKISQNRRSLANLIDTFWVDQPGMSYSFSLLSTFDGPTQFVLGFTADLTGYGASLFLSVLCSTKVHSQGRG